MQGKFSWVPSLSVGNDELDKQHQQLLEHINMLITEVSGGASQSGAIEQALHFLDRYIDEHFKDEEEYMRRHEYDQTEAHSVMHRAFIDRYVKMKEYILRFGSTERAVSELELHLAHWWVDHIGTADKRYADFIKEREKMF
jgi:hemerythrin